MKDDNIILYDIEVLRDKLSNVIKTKDELVDVEILRVSVQLDEALNEYYRLKFKRLGTIINYNTIQQ